MPADAQPRAVQRTAVISINASWNVVNFRRGLVEALRAQGWRVVALTPSDQWSPQLADIGADHMPLAIDSRGLSPLRDFALLLRYRRLLKQLRPDVFLGFTAKPNVWGSLAAASLKVTVINNISGLGTAFIEGGLLQKIVMALYRIALRRSATVFFQNPDDLKLFLEGGLVREEQVRLLPGSGIDLGRFSPTDRSADTGPFAVLMMGRLLWQKGIAQYVEAARIVRRQASDVRFWLLGFLDAANRSAVDREAVEGWAREDLIDYLGATDDVRPHIQAADCVVLPSYREGLPRSLLEAAAMAKPLIATDVPGCREIVEHGVNGLLCAVADGGSLAEAMLQMIAQGPERRRAMGTAGRRKVEETYSEAVAVRQYLDAIGDAITRR
jgi:glycosyltransferase involved in cell wall biosynthesis